jgi:hypothetical protein
MAAPVGHAVGRRGPVPSAHRGVPAWTISRPHRVAGLAAAVAAVVAVGAASTTTAADALDGAAGASRNACVGSIQLDLRLGGPDGPTRPFVGTLTSDRTAIISAPGATGTFVPGGADVEFSSAGHGAWQPTGRSSCRVTVVQIDAGADGQLSGSSRATVTLRFDRESVTAEGTTDTFDPAGTLVGEDIPISGTGTRIRVDR